jgi:hypothetical protein
MQASEGWQRKEDPGGGNQSAQTKRSAYFKVYPLDGSTVLEPAN